MNSDNSIVLDVNDLSVRFRMYTKGTVQKELEVIPNLSVQVRTGEILAVVGSSGSGKSILASAILGLLPGNAITTGSMKYLGKELTPETQQRLRGTQIAYIPQSVSYLDPLMRVDRQVRGTRATREKQRAIFQRMELGPEVEKMYPHQLSGGMARRVLVSAAVIDNARLLIADEPTPGMSIDLAKEALKIFRELADQGKSVMLITHDVDLALNVADRIAVFYAGTTLEMAPSTDFSGEGERLRHPYTKAFYAALPQTHFQPIPGTQPYAGTLPEGWVFAPRCPNCTEECMRERPPMRELRDGFVRCCHAV